MTQSDLEKLLEKARTVRATPADREAQRRSFAYGNTRAENDRITRKTIDDAADRLSSTKEPRGAEKE